MKNIIFLLFTSILLGACKTQKIEPIASNNIIPVDKRPQSLTIYSISDTTNKTVYNINYNADSLLVRITNNLKNSTNPFQTTDVLDKFIYENKILVSQSKTYFSGSDDLNRTFSYTYEGNKIKSILYDSKFYDLKVTNYYKDNALSYILIDNNYNTIDSLAIKYQNNNAIFCKTYLYKDVKNKVNELNDSTIYNYANNKLEIQRYNNDNTKLIFNFQYLNKKIEVSDKLEQFLLMKIHPASNKYIINIHDLIIADYVPLNYCISYQSFIGFEYLPIITYSYKFDSLDRLVEISNNSSKTVFSY